MSLYIVQRSQGPGRLSEAKEELVSKEEGTGREDGTEAASKVLLYGLLLKRRLRYYFFM